MTDAASTLVIILSVFLAIFLLLASILLVLLVRVTMQIKKITKSAQHTVESVDSLVSGAARYASPAMAAKFAISQIKKVAKKGGKR